MSVTTFIKNVYESDAEEARGRASVIGRMLLILLGGVIVAAVAIGAVVGTVSLIWGGAIVSIVQQLAGI
ncbi:hypothetical protein HII28_17770 [Planctomonas sp. JC2975]|uniref:hypothetical protein n=1 Tax=Planctomonas sp. JC2975 TaxID=2729626 RepID=UPI001476380C|nr:hypothetical protein [Planctomonas sp. JC2975]NNC13716.1 hypothetical protein [Planctomonas sp. JC2975]